MIHHFLNAQPPEDVGVIGVVTVSGAAVGSFLARPASRVVTSLQGHFR